jgi:hypothetical protein
VIKIADRNERVTRAIEEGLAIPYDRDKIKLASLELESKKIELGGKRNYSIKIQYLTGYSASEIDAVHYDLVPYLIVSDNYPQEINRK